MGVQVPPPAPKNSGIKMNIIQHNKNKLHHSIIFQIPEMIVNTEYEKQLQNFSEKAKIPGFRPGKIPQSVLQQRYGASAYSDAVEECVHRSLHTLYTQEKLRPCGQPEPQVTIESAHQGKDVQVKVEFEVLPDIEIDELNSLKFEVLKPKIEDQDILNVIQNMLKEESPKHALSVERASKMGDNVKIDFEGSLEGTVRPEMCGQGFDLTLGSGTFIPGFEDQLTGFKSGENTDVSLNFPTDYHSEEFAGKPALFKVKILEVQEIPLLEINEENIKKMGFENLQKLKDIITQNITTHYEKIAWKKSKRAILDVLEEKFHFEVPSGMHKEEFQSIWKQFQTQLKEQAPSESLTLEEETKIKAKYQSIAERRVRLGLFLSKIGDIHKIEIQKNEFEAELLYREQTNPAWINRLIQQELKGKKQPVLLKQIQAELFEDKVLQFIVHQGQVHETALSITDLNKETNLDQEKIFEE